ncbi:hypothetical protein N0V86_008225 [Didymella sp. IMI 355093]|nr:hypothetical protein N0V86_008225 [Didymella sp. IMI 355093]
MAELPEGRQHCGPSKLRNVQQVPDSDTVVLETQLKADQYGIEYEDLDDEDLAVLARNSVKKPAGSTATSGQAPTAPFQTALFVRPGTAKIEEPKIWSRQASNKTLPKEGASAAKFPVHSDTVVPSVEPPAQEIPRQGKKAMETYAHKLTSPKMIIRARTAFLADQCRQEDQMLSKEQEWKGERSGLQTTITKQLETIAEQRVKLEQAEKRFKHLAGKLKSTQKFVAGLQKDHENLQMSMVAFQEQTKRVLQEEIAQILKEKDELRGAFEALIDSCAKSRKSMHETMTEIQLHYLTALLRQNDLNIRLDERVTMYEEEKHRRIELEQQLLPSVQSMQRHLNEGAATLTEKISSLQASMADRTPEDDRDSTANKSLLILQKLQSLPLLTSNDVRKAEGMLRYLYERSVISIISNALCSQNNRTDAGFKLVAKDSESDPFPIGDVRGCIRDQIQGLQAEILRNDQAIADGQLAREANELLTTEIETEKQNNQRLEEQATSLRHSEATLKSRITDLELGRDDLRTVVQEHQAQSHKHEQRIAELEAQLDKVNKGHERQHLKETLNFCKYRTDALAHLANLSERVRQITDEDATKHRECNALKQDAGKLRAQLESEQTKASQLTAKIARNDSAIRIIEQEKNDAIEKEGSTRDSLRSAEGSKLELETENRKLSADIKTARTDLYASRDAEQRLISQCSELQEQFKALQDGKSASDEQLRQVQHDSANQLQQAKMNYTASIDNLKSDLTLSEDAHKELQAKLRQMETGLKEQIEHHGQKFNAKFDSLAAQSQQKHEKLKAKHKQEMESCKQDAEARIAMASLEAQRHVDEADARVDEMKLEIERRSRADDLSTFRNLVPNTQQSEQNSVLSSQESLPGRTRKKVDRQTNSVTVVIASSNTQLNNYESESVVNGAALSSRRREGSENQVGYFEQEYESEFGSRVPSQDRESQLSVLDPETEVVSETQNFEYGQSVAAQFQIIESQVVADDNADHEDDLTDLSTMLSEDLSEMLMDIQSASRQQSHTPTRTSSPNEELRTPGQSVHDMASDTRSTNSRGRPKSRANTASRMMPLPQDEQRQRTHADENTRRLSQMRAERDDNHDTPDSMHSNGAAAKRINRRRSEHDAGSGHKRKAAGSRDDNGSSKKLHTSAQAIFQRSSSLFKSYAPYTPSPTIFPAQNNSNPSPASATSCRSSYRKSSAASSQGGTPRLSSTRNTRSKSMLPFSPTQVYD